MNVAYIDTMIFQNLDVFFPNQEVSGESVSQKEKEITDLFVIIMTQRNSV